MSFASRAQASTARMVQHFGGGLTATVHRRATTANVNTGGVTSNTTTDYDFPAVMTQFMQRDIDGTLVQDADRMLVIDTTAGAITITDDDAVTVNGSVLTIERVMPLQPGDSLSAVRLHVRGS